MDLVLSISLFFISFFGLKSIDYLPKLEVVIYFSCRMYRQSTYQAFWKYKRELKLLLEAG